MKSGDYAFAAQRIARLKNQVFCGGQPILRYNGERTWPILPILTKIPKGELLVDEDQKKLRITNSEDLRRYGFIIVVEKLSKKEATYFSGQSKRYKLVRVNSAVNPEPMPKDHYVVYYLDKKIIRLIGKNAGIGGRGPAIEVKRKAKKIEDDFESIISNSSLYNPDGFIAEEVKAFEWVDIPEIPVMICEDGRLVCIEKSHDEPTIGWVGIKRIGKTWGKHGFLDRVYWKWGIKICLLNDLMNEYYTWCLPWVEVSNASRELSISREIAKINEHTIGLPTVYLTPITNTLEGKYTLKGTSVSFLISLPFKDLLKNYNWYVKGIKEWTIEGAVRTLRKMENVLVSTLREESPKNKEQFMSILRRVTEKYLPDTQVINGKTVRTNNSQMRNALYGRMEDIYDQNFLDISSHVPAFWKVVLSSGYEGYYNPILAVMLAGGVPVVETRDAQSKEYFGQWFRFFLFDLYHKQNNDPYFINNNIRIWVDVGEITGITSSQKPGPASDILGKIAAEGGPSRIGLLWETQNYTRVPDRIRTNTKTLFCFKLVESEAAEVARNFGLSKIQKNKITQSLKKFEMLAITYDKFVCYDADGNREVLEASDEGGTVVLRGKVLPPLSMHKAPDKNVALS